MRNTITLSDFPNFIARTSIIQYRSVSPTSKNTSPTSVHYIIIPRLPTHTYIRVYLQTIHYIIRSAAKHEGQVGRGDIVSYIHNPGANDVCKLTQ